MLISTHMRSLFLQIEGSKEWDLYEDHPTQYPKLEHHDSFDPQQMTPTKFTLNKGDLLYIPRGIWHSATTADEPSSETFGQSAYLPNLNSFSKMGH